MELTDREIANILVALRYWQEESGEYPELLDRFDDHFNPDTPLTDDEIDALCLRINTSE
jgi:hypothetical protein